MKQVLQYRKNGDVVVRDVPVPQLQKSGILVRNCASLISAGTERAGIELTQKSMIGMAQERPDLVRRVLDKLHRDGLQATWSAVVDQLDRYVSLGYSSAGFVTARADGVNEFELGELVACAGAGNACHAEVNFVPRLLACSVPAGVTAEQAAYSTLGAIALQGVRNANVQLGETVAVIGLGLIGQLATQILKSAGCRVIGFDVSQDRANMAIKYGAIAAFSATRSVEAEASMRLTRGRGVDAVLICAATKSNGPIEFAAQISRDRGRVVMVGVTGMDLPRNDYYHKELSVTVSRSYGPGRYDANYEERGQDYPIGYVRWTEQRNLEAFLDLVAAGSVHPEVLTTHYFPVADAEDAYELILSRTEPHMGVVLEYPQPERSETISQASRIVIKTTADSPRKSTKKLGVSLIGVGNFARGTLLRHLTQFPEVQLQGILSASGHSAATSGKKFGFNFCTSRVEDLVEDDQTDAVVIATRHSQHAELVRQFLEAGKQVFVEKPLAVNLKQLQSLLEIRAEASERVMVGFNRRFAPMARSLKEHFQGVGPLTMHYRVNAGHLAPDHWLASPEEGGRMIGEGCHFIDFFSFLTSSRPRSVFAVPIGDAQHDGLDVIVTYADGSVGHLTYATSGASRTSKEHLEVFGGGRTGILDDFRLLELHSGIKRVARQRPWAGQNKGHQEELKTFVQSCIHGESSPISFASLVDTTLVTIAAVRSATRRIAVDIDGLREEMERQVLSYPRPTVLN